MSHIAFVALGSNLGSPCRQLRQAFEDINHLLDTHLIASSSLYRSAPVGYLDQPDFVNAVVKIETQLTPADLLQGLLNIEHDHGRERTFQNAPRLLDLDVLLYDDVQLHQHGLTIPHPQMHFRAFVLLPLLEVSPECVIPGVGAAAQVLRACQNQLLERIVDDV
jgi:2-amino-4-hydroxy-6-hydroxymethyldihydropteridine diphosphokinase